MRENFYTSLSGQSSPQNRYWRFITKPLSLLAMAVMLLWTTAANAQCGGTYCASNFTSVGFEWVSNVSFAGINNSSDGIIGGPVDYTDQSATVTIGTPYTLSVTINADGSEYVYAWIDWNQNGSFLDDGEVYIVVEDTNQDGPHEISITPPAGATLGSTRMRVMLDFGNDISDPCRSATWGEAEDYCVNVMASAECAGVSSLGNTLSTTASVCSAINFTLSLQNAPTTSGMVYQWQTSPDGTTWTNAGPNAPQWTTQQTATTYYQCVVTCTAASESETSAPVQVEGVSCINHPAGTGSSTFTSCNGTYYDTGGIGGQYSNNQNSTLTIYPESGNLVQVTFTAFEVESGYDYILIYDGENTSAPTINSTYLPGFGTAPAGAWTGATSPVGQIFTGTSGPLTFRFFSDGSVTYNGWQATISCITAPDCMPPTGLVATATSESSGTLTWNAPDATPLSYDVYHNTTGVAPDGSTTPTLAGVAGLSETFNGLEIETSHYFWVRANCATDQSIWIGPVSFYLGYCEVTSTNVNYGVGNFTTTNGITNINNPSGPGTYSNYTALSVSQFETGTVNFSISAVTSTAGMGLWIDWNNDFDFSDSGEQIYMSNGYVTVGTGSFVVPTGTPLGDYRMRVVSNFLTSTPTPCGTLGFQQYGEAEDYTLTVIDPPSCIPPSGLAGTGVTDGSSTLTWNASISESVIGYEWVVVALGGAVTDTPIASGTTVAGITTATASGLENYTVYTVYVRTDCGDGDYSLWAGPYNLPGPCTTATFGLYPSATFQPTCNGIVNTITTIGYASEYSNVQVYEDEEYIFSSSISTDIITISNDDASIVYTVGIGSVTWTATTTGVVRFYTHLVGCGQSSTSRSRNVQCGEPWVNEADVEILYTLGGLPVVFGDNHVIQALITNPAADTWTKDVTLTITGANTFTSVYSLTLEGNSSQLISFEPFTATNTGMQTVTVSVEDDNVNSNNTYTVQQLVTTNLFSHKEPDAPMAVGGVGIGGGYTGNFVAKFTTAAAGEVNEIKVDFTGNGGVNYQYRIFAADGTGGLPGTVLFESPVMISAPGQAFLPVSPTVPVDGDFYVGLRELGTNFQFNYQDEDPLRTGIFYFNTEDGTYPWTDISTSNAPTARLAIEAQLFTETPPNCAINTAPANEAIVCYMDGSVTLSWTSGGGAPTGYHLYFGTDENPEFLADVTGTSYEVEDIIENDVYYWYIVPFNEYGDASCTDALSFSANSENCLNDEPCTAAVLTVGSDCEYQTYTTEEATSTVGVEAPTCGNYQGGDVWFAITVPGNGQVIITTENQGIGDAAMAAYTANACDSTFTQIACNDDTNGLMPALNLTGLQPGTTVYARVWRYGNSSAGMFGICATTPCGAPVNPVIEIDNNTATISWTSMGDAASYNWELRLYGDAGSGEDGLVDSGTTEAGVTTITITDLEYLSIYNFYISTNCAEDLTSSWSAANLVVTGPMPGCTDPTACNYNPDAGVDDGSCVAEGSTWYQDADGDGYGNAAASEEACVAPVGYVDNNTDCNDTDEGKWQSASLYTDNDGDGYTIGAATTVCYGATVPAGYSATSLGDDCNDNNPNSWGSETLTVALNLIVTEFCHNSAAITLTGGSPAGGTWSGPGVSNGVFNPGIASEGTHTITYAVAGDGICTIGGSASANVTVNICAGIDESDANEIMLYPTYTTGDVTVTGKNLKEAVIMDLNGKRINTVSLNNTSVISMHEYPAGIYFVRITGDNKVRTFKVVRVN